MPWLKDHYQLYFNEKPIGSYYTYDNGSCSYIVGYRVETIEGAKEALEQRGLLKNIESKKPIKAIEAMIDESKRVQGKKKPVYVDGPFKLERIPQESGERFLVYSRGANKNEPGYSEKDHSAPHYEGPKTPEGMREWASWYAFVKMDDGTYEAALDEAWWWGGGHNDGGTIHNEIPEEWFELTYDEFLENVVRLSAASHYGFTPEELKEKDGLKAFFGFEED